LLWLLLSTALVGVMTSLLPLCARCSSTQRVNELTRGASLKANLALVRNNADVGARIAVELSAQRRRFSSSAASRAAGGRAVVVGGAVMDMICQPAVGSKLRMETSNPGTVRQQLGGASA
jgi:pseudouridine-5'-phosphate glycosidase/pseudouridine kinase